MLASVGGSRLLGPGGWVGDPRGVAILALSLQPSSRGTTMGTLSASKDGAPTSVPAAGPSLVAPMRPGTYYYDVVGNQMTSSHGPQPVQHEATMTVEPLAGSDQRIVRYSLIGTTEVAVRYRSDGLYLTRLRLETPTYALAFEPPEPLPVLMLPSTPGRTWAWSAISDDGGTTAEATFAISREVDLPVGESAVRAVVVSAHIRLSGRVEATLQQMIWRSTSDASALVERETVEGKAGDVVFRSDVRWTMRSTRAA